MNTSTETKDERGYLEFDFCALDAGFERPLTKPAKDFPNLTGYICPDGRLALWSGAQPVPDLGFRVMVQFWNKWVDASVQGYFREDGWLGLIVKPFGAPSEYLKRNNGKMPQKVHVFGLEVRRLA